MTDGQGQSPDPLPLPRSLRTHRAIRVELASLYRQAKAGRIDPPLLGRLVHLLSVLAGIISATEIEQRLAKLEAAAEADPDWPGPPNGRADHAAHH